MAAYLINLIDHHGSIGARAFLDREADEDVVNIAKHLVPREWTGFDIWEDTELVCRYRTRTRALREEFKLNAVRYRRAQGDLQMFMAAFAARMDHVIPGRITFDRGRNHFLFAARDFVRLTIDTEPNLYIVIYDKEQLSAARAKSVRGKILKSEAMALPEWAAALGEDIRRLSHKGAEADEILHDLLDALPGKHRPKSVLERYFPSDLVTTWSMSPHPSAERRPLYQPPGRTSSR